MSDIVEDTEAPPDREDEDADDHPAGIYHTAVIIGVLALFTLIPYTVPRLADFRVWIPGEEPPFTGLFELKAPIARPKIAGGGRTKVATQSDDELLAAAPLPEAPPEIQVPHATDDPVEHESSTSAALAPRIPSEHFAGLTRQIEEPRGEEMSFFYNQLAAVGREDEGALARITVYSVSTNGADRVTSTVRHQLQELFGDGGKGFIHASPGWTYQSHRDVLWEHINWRTSVVNRGQIEDGRYGFGGVIATNMGPRSTISYATVDEGPSNREISLWRIFYQAWPRGGEMVLSVDGRERERLSLASESVEDRVHEVPLPQGPHQVSIGVGDGSLRLYGSTLETDGPGVVVDGLMFIGASVRMIHHFDEAHLADQVRHRAPDLIVFWLGGNDVISAGFTRERFQNEYAKTIGSVRAGRPEASCLVVSVLDKGYMVNGRIRTRVYVDDVVAGGEHAARDQGCAFLNLFEATGGEGTMARWYRSAPRLAVSDFNHLTEAGARVVGSLIARAILRGYDDYLAESER